MENYEEKYKQALKRAKTILELTDNLEEANGYVFTIFPELCESEDERIRKGLIKGLSAMRDIHKHQTFSDYAISIDDAIAWLEKQEEITKCLPKWKKIPHGISRKELLDMMHKHIVLAFNDCVDYYYLDESNLRKLPKEE